VGKLLIGLHRLVVGIGLAPLVREGIAIFAVTNDVKRVVPIGLWECCGILSGMGHKRALADNELQIGVPIGTVPIWFCMNASDGQRQKVLVNIGWVVTVISLVNNLDLLWWLRLVIEGSGRSQKAGEVGCVV
jgi:hypothetical protein